jgi:hypothetical protein
MVTRTVRVVDRSTWGTPAPYPLIRRVTVPWVCCTCGGERGEPFGHCFYENDQSHVCDRWSNPCGHVDTYEMVLRQAREMANV